MTTYGRRPPWKTPPPRSARLFSETIDYARTAQQIIDLATSVGHVVDDLLDLHKRRPDLGPEVASALDHLAAASRALTSAHTAASATLDVRTENITESLDEGGPS